MTNELQIEGASGQCHACGKALCLRKQVINLALGNTDEMKCLVCLAEENEKEPVEVLEGTKTYVLSRECFRKQWHLYACEDQCPEPLTCFPARCFES